MSDQKVKTLLSDTQSYLKSTTELCNNIANTEDFPPVFKEVGKCVFLVQNILQFGQNQLETSTLDIEDERLLVDLENSKKEALHLYRIFKVIAPPSETTPAQLYQKVIRNRSKDCVEGILLKLLEGLNRLVTKDLITASDEQVNTLGEVIEEVMGLGSEGKEEGGREGAGYEFSGTGNMFNNTGNGNQHVNTGMGPQHNATNMTLLSSSLLQDVLFRSGALHV